MSNEPFVTIRRECLQPALYWARPTGAEVQEVLRQAGFTGRLAADYLDLAEKSGRQIRKWISEDAPIPYASWALLCYAAGYGAIWEISIEEMRKSRRRGPGHEDQAQPDSNESMGN